MSDWKQQAEELKLHRGESWTQTALHLMESGFFPGCDLSYVKERVRTHIRRCDGYQTAHTKKAAGERFESVSQNLTPAVTTVKFTPTAKTIRFGLISDTHLGGKYAQITHLHKFYSILSQRGIDVCYHAGDIDEGEQMRLGHQYECYLQGTDDRVEHIAKVFPDDVKTFFICGNHDASHMKRCGVDIGKSIASLRPDMTYLGRDAAIIKLTPNCTLELRHPWDGTAYALSCKIQKMIDAMPGGEKPNILAVGHYHKTEQLLYRNVFCFQTGCFQSQTPFERGKGISTQIGGWIVEADVDSAGTIEAIRSEFIPFFYPVKEDYKNWIGR